MRNQFVFEKGFTLVELLVAIGIIAILAAMLFPVLSRAKAGTQRTTCMKNIRQINLGLRMYSGDSSDYSPKTPHTNNFPSLANIVDFTVYKEVMKHNFGLSNASSPGDKIFACPADTFYYNLVPGGQPFAAQGMHEQPFTDYSSYGFNGVTGTNQVSGERFPSIAGRRLSSVKNPARTLMVFEIPAIFPYSWHQPKRPFSAQNAVFNDAKNMVSFVDGHASYSKIYWTTNRVLSGGVSYITDAVDYDPPAGYDYQWSGD